MMADVGRAHGHSMYVCRCQIKMMYSLRSSFLYFPSFHVPVPTPETKACPSCRPARQVPLGHDSQGSHNDNGTGPVSTRLSRTVRLGRPFQPRFVLASLYLPANLPTAHPPVPPAPLPQIIDASTLRSTLHASVAPLGPPQASRSFMLSFDHHHNHHDKPPPPSPPPLPKVSDKVTLFLSPSLSCYFVLLRLPSSTTPLSSGLCLPFAAVCWSPRCLFYCSLAESSSASLRFASSSPPLAAAPRKLRLCPVRHGLADDWPCWLTGSSLAGR